MQALFYDNANFIFCLLTFPCNYFSFVYNGHMIREKYFEKLQKESSGRGQITRLAVRIGIPIVTLWRIVNGKSKGSADTWDAIFSYYGK